MITYELNHALSRIHLPSDTVASVLLAEWHLSTEYFDGSTIGSPVPRFLASYPSEARDALSCNR
jgi:hypothetical protein